MSINNLSLSLTLRVIPDGEHDDISSVSIVEVQAKRIVEEDQEVLPLWVKVGNLLNNKTIAFWKIDEEDERNIFTTGLQFRIARKPEKQRVEIKCRFSYEGSEHMVASNDVTIPARG